jgi:superfamily II DNA or RNA helicase
MVDSPLENFKKQNKKSNGGIYGGVDLKKKPHTYRTPTAHRPHTPRMLLLYAVSSDSSRVKKLVKLGLTVDLRARLSTYNTGCPPGQLPACEITADAAWEISSAEGKAGLVRAEKIMHNLFRKYRMQRRIPNDCEWFDFSTHPDVVGGVTPVDVMREAVRCSAQLGGIAREIDVGDIQAVPRRSRYMTQQQAHNTAVTRTVGEHAKARDESQREMTAAMTEFICGDDSAGYAVAPCGSGKTRMTCNSMRESRVSRTVICCPSQAIQLQWVHAVIASGAFDVDQICLVGEAGTTNRSEISDHMQLSTYCVITTYMSSHLLALEGVELLVLDEAHHLAGRVAPSEGEDASGHGRTRRLMLRAAEQGIKRLSLTFTPRIVARRAQDDEAETVLTMDDEQVFGKRLAEIKLRDLIRLGVLPDYRLWSLMHDAGGDGDLHTKGCAILEAWRATETVRSVDTLDNAEQPILHHLLVFAANNSDAAALAAQFTAGVDADTLVIRVQGGDDVCAALCQFNTAARAILVNCKVLGEGVDIPIANAVAVTYNKHAVGETVQMLLRPGRWYEGKDVFHMLLPNLGPADLSGFESVLASLATCDAQLLDEITVRAGAATDAPVNTKRSVLEAGLASPAAGQCSIVIDQFNGDLDSVRACFANIRRRYDAQQRRQQRKPLNDEDATADCNAVGARACKKFKGEALEKWQPHLPFVHGVELPAAPWEGGAENAFRAAQVESFKNGDMIDLDNTKVYIRDDLRRAHDSKTVLKKAVWCEACDAASLLPNTRRQLEYIAYYSPCTPKTSHVKLLMAHVRSGGMSVRDALVS